jgi:hypothetical protein
VRSTSGSLPRREVIRVRETGSGKNTTAKDSQKSKGKKRGKKGKK